MVQSGKIANPHLYLALWLMCRKLQGDSTVRVLPDVGGLLDQDYMTIWSFGIIDDAYRAEIDIKESFERDKAKHAQLRQDLMSKTKRS